MGHDLSDAWIIDFLQTEFTYPLIKRWSCHYRLPRVVLFESSLAEKAALLEPLKP